jgi:hypothetical protein
MSLASRSSRSSGWGAGEQAARVHAQAGRRIQRLDRPSVQGRRLPLSPMPFVDCTPATATIAVGPTSAAPHLAETVSAQGAFLTPSLLSSEFASALALKERAPDSADERPPPLLIGPPSLLALTGCCCSLRELVMLRACE